MTEPSILPGHSRLILVVQLKQLFDCDSLDMIDGVLLECLDEIVFNGVFVQIDKVELFLRWHSKVDRSGWDGCVELWNSSGQTDANDAPFLVRRLLLNGLFF